MQQSNTIWKHKRKKKTSTIFPGRFPLKSFKKNTKALKTIKYNKERALP